MTQPECESALSPEDHEDDGSEYFKALDRHDVSTVNTPNDVPVQPSTLINLRRPSRRIE
jgi:hypothetical protein